MTAAVLPAEFIPVDLPLAGGRRVTLRAVHPQDKDAMQAAIKRLSAESRYARFMTALRELPPQMLERAVNPDQARELQLVAVCGEGAQQKIVGGARYVGSPGSGDCEFAVTVADEWQGLGLARQLLQSLMQAARARGLERMEGYILASNSRMLGLARRLGFIEVPSPEGPGVRLVRRDLGRAASR